MNQMIEVGTKFLDLIIVNHNVNNAYKKLSQLRPSSCLKLSFCYGPNGQQSKLQRNSKYTALPKNEIRGFFEPTFDIILSLGQHLADRLASAFSAQKSKRAKKNTLLWLTFFFTGHGTKPSVRKFNTLTRTTL